MNTTSTDKLSAEDGGAIVNRVVRRSLFHRLNWSGFWVVAVAGFFLIEGRERLVREVWEYGTCEGKKARRHTVNGNVQFVLWRKGDQKEVDGIGHLEDKWVDFDRSWWSLFVSDDCA